MKPAPLAALTAALAAVIGGGVAAAVTNHSASTKDAFYACVSSAKLVRPNTIRLNGQPSCPAANDTVHAWLGRTPTPTAVDFYIKEGPQTYGPSLVHCKTGDIATGGGGFSLDPLTESRPLNSNSDEPPTGVPNGWEAWAAPGDHQTTAYVTCQHLHQ